MRVGSKKDVLVNTLKNLISSGVTESREETEELLTSRSLCRFTEHDFHHRELKKTNQVVRTGIEKSTK